MKKRAGSLFLCLLMAASAALAEPLALTEDLSGEIREQLNEKAAYIYSYRYPRAAEGSAAAEQVNSFFRYRAEDAAGFEVPMNADYYRGTEPEADIRVEVDYRVTCNDGEYFSVLTETRQEGLSSWSGYTFSMKGLKPGLSVALPYLLGLLEGEETDTWLQDRQTARADAAVREMVWAELQARNGKDLELAEDLEREALDYAFFPEEDFYLEENGDPVFFLQPGTAEASGRLITVTIPVEDILDEM